MKEDVDDPLALIANAIHNEPVIKTYRKGSHRSVAPSETISRVSPHKSKLGITRVANVTGLDRIGVPVVMVCRPNSRSIAVCQGKGADINAAIASGLMEAAEIHHAERIDLPLRLGNYSDIKARFPVINIDKIPRIAGSIFSDKLVMLWIEGFDLLGKQRLWLPYEVVRADYTLPMPPGSGCFDASTNGLASGNHILEAVCHGICEVIERDANALWSQLDLAAQRQTRVDVNSIEEEYCEHILRKLKDAHFDIGVWETTSDIEVPSFYAVITETAHFDTHIGVGSGCHPSRTIALSRALTEAVQVRTTYISGTRDDLMLEEYDPETIKRRRAWADKLLKSDGVNRFNSGPEHNTDSFNEDLAWLLNRLHTCGVEQVVAVNLSKGEFDLPVVKIVVPVLEGPSDHEAYVPGERASRAKS